MVGNAIAADPTGSISGTVTRQSDSSPIVGAAVFVNGVNGLTANTTTDIAGNYTVTGLGTSDYKVHVNATQQGIPVQYYVNSPTAAGADPVPVVDGADTPGINFVIATAGSVTGQVTETDGTTAIPNADVWASRFDGAGGGRGATTDANGDYVIDGLSAGQYRVESAAPVQGFVREFWQEVAVPDLAISVTVTTSATTTNINFTLSGGGEIAGTVYDFDGTTPLEGVHVWAHRFGGGGGNGTRTDALGNYSLPGLPAGDYRVRAEPDDSTRVAEYYDATADWSEAVRVPVTAGTPPLE